MVTLNKYVPAWGLSDFSPFCVKVETYLRMANVPFRVVVADGRKAPKQKLPVIEDGGKIVCDSRDIIDHFEAKLEKPLDAELTPRERATAVAFRGLIEEEMYFLHLVQRWQQEANWRTYKPALREYGKILGVPNLLAPIVMRSIRKQVLRDAWGQGSGRHGAEEIDKRLCQALDAISFQLGDGPGPFFFGARPRVIDATVYAFLASMLDTPFESGSRSYGLGLQNLTAYRARMRSEYFADRAAA
jgi:glutathione S-transferase